MVESTQLIARIAPSVIKEQLEVILSQPLAGKKYEIPSAGRTVEVWYHKAASPGAPVLFEMHGGGFLFNHAAKNDAFRQTICAGGDINVVGINYRKSPRHPYPAALEDVLGVIGWFWENADTLRLDKHRFFICGESAGANLAAVTANTFSLNGKVKIQGQILHYPFVDLTAVQVPVYPTDLPEEVVRAFMELYCDDEAGRRDPFVSPVCADSGLLAGTAAALIITAEYDTLKVSGQLYAEHLRAAGVDVRVLEMPGAHHGYIEDWFNPACYDLLPENERKHHATNLGELARRAAAETVAFVRRQAE